MIDKAAVEELLAACFNISSFSVPKRAKTPSRCHARLRSGIQDNNTVFCDVWTFLDPKGKYKPEELKEQEREIKRDTKKARKEEFKNKAAEPQLIYRKKDNRRRSEEERQRS